MKTILSLAVAVLTLTLLGCKTSTRVYAPHHAMANSAIAVLHPTAGNSAAGTVRFTQSHGEVQVIADLTGLPPSSSHGFHIHEYGDCSSPDGNSAGGHFAGEGTMHGRATDAFPHRHAGDMGNIEADSSGRAHLELTLHDVSIEGRNAILGHAVILHAKPDDYSQPTGNAGGRIACGVIGIGK